MTSRSQPTTTEPLGPCTQAEIDAWIQTIDSKNAKLIVMWMERAHKAEAQLASARKALEEILVDPPATLDEPDTDAEVIIKIREIARATIKDIAP